MPGPLPKSPLQLTPEQERHVPQLSSCSTAPFAAVQRARILLLAPQYPPRRQAESARQGGGWVQTVKHWRQRWQQTDRVWDAPRAGTRRAFPALQRAQRLALACSAPRAHGTPWPRGSGEKLAQVAIEQPIVAPTAPGPMRAWLRQDTINPWRSHAWQRSTDPHCVAKARPGRDLDEHAQALAAQGEAVVCRDEQTSSQARQRVSTTKAAAPGYPRHGAERYTRLGAVPLCWALVVAVGLTFARTRSGRKLADFQACLLEVLPSALGAGLQGVHLILAHGSTHAPKPLGPWMASLALSCAVRIDWWPTHARWLDQGEIICSKVQRDGLTPNDFPSTLALEKQRKTYVEDESNRHPKPLQWTYTQTKMLAKFGTSQPVELAA
jgi:DDE superfamily endonuclease